MARRRDILAAENGGYVRSGLVLWMDGIDKGSTAGVWTDKAAGHVFESVNGFTNGENYVGLSAASSQYLRNASFTSPESHAGTIEVVISDYDAKSLIFMPKDYTEMAFGITSTGNKIITSTYAGIKTINITFGAKIFSVCNDVLAIVDGTAATFNSGDAWGSVDENYNYIGRRNSSNNYQATAKIHAIRIYDRFLTRSEILRNQRIDNKRFHLGLSI